MMSQNIIYNMEKIEKFSEMNDEQRLQRAKAADLITLPENIEGTNCANCKFVKTGENLYCTHKKVLQNVTPKMCCIYWDAEGVIREWEK